MAIWVDLQKEFLNKIFLVHRTTTLKKQIQKNFEKINEQFYDYWGEV